MGDELEQRLEALARLGEGLELAEDGLLLHGFPAFEGGRKQRLARREMPIEAALGDAQTAGQRLDRHGRHTVIRDDIEGSIRPVFGGETHRSFVLGGGGHGRADGRRFTAMESTQ